MYTKAVGTAIFLTIANFLYQAMTQANWMLAAERSFFQVVAITAFVIALSLDRRLK